MLRTSPRRWNASFALLRLRGLTLNCCDRGSSKEISGSRKTRSVDSGPYLVNLRLQKMGRSSVIELILTGSHRRDHLESPGNPITDSARLSWIGLRTLSTPQDSSERIDKFPHETALTGFTWDSRVQTSQGYDHCQQRLKIPWGDLYLGGQHTIFESSRRFHRCPVMGCPSLRPRLV